MSQLTLADAKTYLGLTTAANDTVVQQVIDAAEARLSQDVGPLTPKSVTERVRGYSDALVLSVVPVISITSVTPVAGGASLVVGSLTIDPNGSGVISFTDGVSVFTAWKYDVVYQAGWSTVPADLAQATREFVRYLFSTQRGGERRGGPGSSTTPDAAPVAGDLPARVQELIEPYINDELGFA